MNINVLNIYNQSGIWPSLKSFKKLTIILKHQQNNSAICFENCDVLLRPNSEGGNYYKLYLCLYRLFLFKRRTAEIN